MNLVEVAEEVQHRIIHIFGRDVDGRRSTNGGNNVLDHDPHFRDYVWFYEVSQMRLHLTSDDLTTNTSFSTAMTEGDLVLLIKLGGLVWWHTIFFKVGPPAVSPKLQRVSFISKRLFDEARPAEPSVLGSSSKSCSPLL